MVLGIDLTVDFAFKKVFGSLGNDEALISLLNAILELACPIEAVEILNPFSYQEFAEQKQVVLDVRCRDWSGRWFNVEMQVAHYPHLLKRLTYYACSLYVDQLERGQAYGNATLALTVCLVRHRLFPQTNQAHHRFQLIDRQSQRELNDAVEVHTVELTKYNLAEHRIATAPAIQQWAFLLLHAHEMDGETLRSLLPGPGFAAAISVLEEISAKTEDRQMYDQRERAKRDYEWGLVGAREEGRKEGRLEGLREGHTKGRKEGREVGREEGQEVGRAQGRAAGLEAGRMIGRLVGKIQLLQELMGESISTDAELTTLEIPALNALLGELQERYRHGRA